MKVINDSYDQSQEEVQTDKQLCMHLHYYLITELSKSKTNYKRLYDVYAWISRYKN